MASLDITSLSNGLYLVSFEAYLYDTMKNSEMELTYQAAKLDDIEFLLELRIETMEEHLINSGINLTMNNHKERILHNFEYAKIIVYEEENIGLLKLLKSKTNYEIEQFQIKKKYQGRGIGKKIIEEIIREANLEELPIKLSVLKKNKAKYLYERLGFRIIGEDKASYYMIKSH